MAWRTMSPETRTVAVLAELPGIYGFILQDIPQVGTVVVVENTTAATGRTVVTTVPNPGEVFVAFDTGQSYCIFNAADDGVSFIVNYSGGGSSNSIQNLATLASNPAAAIHAAASKNPPVDADEFGGTDSASSFSLVKFTWANIKAALLTYFTTAFNALYEPKIKFAIISNTQTSGTGAGATSTGSWGIVPINAEDYDLNGIVTVASNKFKPIAGVYHLSARSPFYSSDRCQIRLYNVDAPGMPTGCEGDSTGPFNATETHAFLDCVFTANGTDEYRIEYQVETANANGLGIAVGFGISEKYFRGILQRIG